VASVEAWFQEALQAGLPVKGLAVFAGLVMALEEYPLLDVTVERFERLRNWTLSVHNPKPGVIRFMLAPDGAQEEEE
jgi:hypothetical protein